MPDPVQNSADNQDAVKPQDATKTEAPKKKEKVPKASFRAVFGGPMLNPLTEDVFTGEPSKPVALDEWLKVQIEAGKIEEVKEEE